MANQRSRASVWDTARVNLSHELSLAESKTRRALKKLSIAIQKWKILRHKERLISAKPLQATAAVKFYQLWG